MIHVPALVLAAALAAPAASTAAPPLVAATPVPDLEILHTGDVQGYLDTCGCKVNPSGGLPRRGWVANQVRTLFPQAGIVLLDAGNFSDNPTSEGEAKTRALVEGMNRLGYAAANVGERDLTAGFPGLTSTSTSKTRRLSKAATMPSSRTPRSIAAISRRRIGLPLTTFTTSRSSASAWVSRASASVISPPSLRSGAASMPAAASAARTSGNATP